ncbi:hypothetical protein E3O62_09295 [Cryobacterium sp. TMT2-15-1]|uniref:hypothetical protein n=1 Tax=Cryobacterium sp. TMT2-15-1 TaxID=1259246 RepID=UPI00106DB196|nr:hypothetical protein [Cryobacterium sp. TMT2-15-1]TFC59579.1 hypothetical protein E3O62_09295 [Cryobacterium sp. TMT2-15-1]
MSASVSEAPTDFTSFELSEWIEMHMFLNGVLSVSRATISTFFPAGQGPDGAEIDQLFAEIRRRAEDAPTLYPFRAIDDTIEIEASIDSTAYFLLQVLSIEAAPFRRQNRFNEINPSFELITREALISYCGPGAQGRRFGWPNGDGRPEHLGDAVAWLANEMGLGVGDFWGEVDSDDKDGGIDVAAWRAFPDGSPSFTTYLAQCTVQMTYERKPGDVVPEKWASWIKFGKLPEVVLSVPFAIPTDAKVRLDLNYKVHVLLDRLRLIYLLDRGASTLSSFPEYEFMKDWTRTEVQLTKNALSQPSGPIPRRPKIRKPLKAVNPNAPRE